MTPLVDRFGRVARKLRISVTDRCNFRCNFCMPRNPVWLDRSELLTFEEIARVARIFARMGVSKIRLTGGEPLMRRGVERLVEILSSIEGIESVSMTTNGYLLEEMAEVLKRAGLSSVTVSLHSLKPERYEQIVGVPGVFEKVVRGIRRAVEVGIWPVKVNVVITRGCNDDEVLDFAELARRTGINVRFIEYMPFDGERLWRPELVVSGDEIVRTIQERYSLVPLEREPGSTSTNYRFADGAPGTIGVITSMTRPFCSDCDRVRLKADGKLVPCMFSTAEYDLKRLLRGGATDEEIEAFIRSAFWNKFEGVESLLRERRVPSHVRPMYTFGG
ncbi:MAG: GTP 3',8-cyclase MoaA [Nitrososphaerota archaeon]